MNKLFEELSKLKRKAGRNILYYIPANRPDLRMLEIFKILPHVINYIDGDGIFHVAFEIPLEQLLAKGEELQENLYNLLELKKTLSEADFDRIIGDYQNFVSQLVSDLNYLSKNHNQPPAVFYPYISELLFFQYKVLRDHNKKLQKEFGNIKRKTVPTTTSTNLNSLKLKDILTCNNPELLEKIILQNYPLVKGKKVRYLIECLRHNRNGYLNIQDVKPIYTILCNTYECSIGTYQSIMIPFDRQDPNFLSFFQNFQWLTSDFQ